MFFEKMPDAEAKRLNPLVLAFVGDAVHSLYVRQGLVLSSDAKAHVLHLKAAKQVNAAAQSDKVLSLTEGLSEEENEIYHRGRNAKQHTVAKNAAVEDYRRASGFEALLGYLYLTGRYERLKELLDSDENRG